MTKNVGAESVAASETFAVPECVPMWLRSTKIGDATWRGSRDRLPTIAPEFYELVERLATAHGGGFVHGEAVNVTIGADLAPHLWSAAANTFASTQDADAENLMELVARTFPGSAAPVWSDNGYLRDGVIPMHCSAHGDYEVVALAAPNGGGVKSCRKCVGLGWSDPSVHEVP